LFAPISIIVKFINILIAIVQTTDQSFNFNGESDLDLEYAMGLTAPQTITLLQTGDIVEGHLDPSPLNVLQADLTYI